MDGHQFTFERREYLLEPYRDNHPWQVEQKATQLGGTVRAILRAIYGARYSGYRNVLYYFPSKTHVLEFSKGRIKPLIEENPHIAEWIRDTDSASIKQIANAFLYMLGMRSTIEVKNIPANMLVFDEFDEAPQLNFDKALERLGGQMEAADVAVHMLSNPTLPDYGVSREFEHTDQRHWMLVCPACGSYHCLEDEFGEWARGKGPPPLVPDGVDGRRVCLRCESTLNPAAGEWVAKRPEITDKRGYHYSQLWSQTFMHSPAKILDKWARAQQTGNLADFWNLTVGIGYVEAQNRLSVQEVLDCCGYDGVASSDPGPCYMGIDQGGGQGDLFHLVIGKRHPVQAGQVLHLGVYKGWEELDRLMKIFHVHRCVIDGMPNQKDARAFARRHPGRVFLSYFSKAQKGDYRWNEADQTVSSNRTENLDASHEELSRAKILLPKECEIVHLYAEHCHAVAKKLEEVEELDPKTQTKRKTGEKRYVYIKLTGKDHFRFAQTYETMARQGAPNQLLPGI
jgi:hypothetical protein